jgi:hypothetical protein
MDESEINTAVRNKIRTSVERRKSDQSGEIDMNFPT